LVLLFFIKGKCPDRQHQDEIQQQLENIAEQTGNEEYEFTDLIEHLSILKTSHQPEQY